MSRLTDWIQFQMHSADLEEDRSSAPLQTDQADQDRVTLVGDSTLARPSGEALSIPSAVEKVVQREGDARRGSGGHVVARLFRPDLESVVVPLADVQELIRNDRYFVWVDLTDYDESDLRVLGEALEVHPHALHAIRSSWQRPSLVVYPDHFLVSVTVARLEPAEYKVLAGQLDLIVGNNVLISAHKLPLPFGERLIARSHHSPDLVQLDAAYMLYIVLDELLAHYEELNRHVQVETEEIEELALHQASGDFLARLLHFKRYAFAVANLADQHRELFAAFLRPDFRWVAGEEVDVYYRDLENHFSRLLESMNGAREAANGAFDIYVSHLSHRTNQIIKVLTVVSTVLFSATVIIGLFGTNLAAVAGGTPGQTPLVFLLMLATVLLVSGGTFWVFHRKGWI